MTGRLFGGRRGAFPLTADTEVDWIWCESALSAVESSSTSEHISQQVRQMKRASTVERQILDEGGHDTGQNGPADTDECR
jgi:hypothetical protein